MADSHIFNEELGRLEPIKKTCAFCENTHTSKMSGNYYCALYKVGKRTNLIVYRSVRYSVIEVGIPRCTKCHLKHKHNLKQGWVECVLIALLVSILFVILTGALSSVFLILFVIILFVFNIPQFIANLKTKKQNIKTEKDSILEDELIKQMLNEGWSRKEPRASLASLFET